PEAAGDLEVALEAAGHEELLVGLRRPGQREDLAGAGGDDEALGRVGRPLREARRLDLDEAVGDEPAPELEDEARAELEALAERDRALVGAAVGEAADRHRLRGVLGAKLAAGVGAILGRGIGHGARYTKIPSPGGRGLG